MKHLDHIKYMNDLPYVSRLLKNITIVGGYTLDNDLEKKKYSDGYQVGVKDMYVVSLAGLTAEKLLRDYLRPMQRENALGYDIGLWLDNGEIYIDFSINIKDFDEAQAVGRENGQKTIYGWAEDDIFDVIY